MGTTLQPVRDPVQAHNLWKAGLLVNPDGNAWGPFDDYASDPYWTTPHSPGVAENLARQLCFICLEE